MLERLRELLQRFDAPTLPPLSEELCRGLDLPADRPIRLTVAQVATVTGLSMHTLRYYERAGLVEVGRDAAGRRSYDRRTLARVLFIARLRASNMPIQQIRHYVELTRAGARTRPQRLAMMQTHRTHVLSQLRELQTALAVIDYKIATYGGRAGEIDEHAQPDTRQRGCRGLPC